MVVPLFRDMCRPEQPRLLSALLGGLSFPSLALGMGPVVALVGAGGKTTLLYALARQLVLAGLKVITTTSTHIFPPAPADSPQYLLSPTPAVVQQALQLHGSVTIASEAITSGKHRGKLSGLSFHAVASLRSVADVVLVEADGAAMRPLKAPAEHEPAVPPCADMCIALCGLGGVGCRVQDCVHRPEYATVLCGCSLLHGVAPEHLAHLTLHPQGLFRTTPASAQRAVLCMLSQNMPLDVGLHLGGRAAEAARQLYPADNAVWWAGSAQEGWVAAL